MVLKFFDGEAVIPELLKAWPWLLIDEWFR
jgi:hypothetical protein